MSAAQGPAHQVQSGSSWGLRVCTLFPSPTLLSLWSPRPVTDLLSVHLPPKGLSGHSSKKGGCGKAHMHLFLTLPQLPQASWSQGLRGSPAALPTCGQLCFLTSHL